MVSNYQKNLFLNYIKNNFGNNSFQFGDIKDNYVKMIMRRYVCSKHTRPNDISNKILIYFDNIIPSQPSKRTKKFRLKEL
jgi:hypothetical protein